PANQGHCEIGQTPRPRRVTNRNLTSASPDANQPVRIAKRRARSVREASEKPGQTRIPPVNKKWPLAGLSRIFPGARFSRIGMACKRFVRSIPIASPHRLHPPSAPPPSAPTLTRSSSPLGSPPTTSRPGFAKPRRSPPEGTHQLPRTVLVED